MFVPQNTTCNKKCSPCSWHCQSAHSHQLSTVACLRCSALLETCTRPHLSYAWGRTGWLAAARVMPNASASAAGWIHAHLCPPFRLLCAHVNLGARLVLPSKWIQNYLGINFGFHLESGFGMLFLYSPCSSRTSQHLPPSLKSFLPCSQCRERNIARTLSACKQKEILSLTFYTGMQDVALYLPIWSTQHTYVLSVFPYVFFSCFCFFVFNLNTFGVVESFALLQADYMRSIWKSRRG